MRLWFFSKRRTDLPLSPEFAGLLDAIKILDAAKESVACSEWHVSVIGLHWLNRVYERLLRKRNEFFYAPGPGR